MYDKFSINQYRGSTTYKTSRLYFVKHVHVYLPHRKGYQGFGSAERNQVKNHELLSKCQVQTFGHVRTQLQSTYNKL